MAYATIKYGSSGSSVKELQKKLNENGYNLAVDGRFGSATRSAVKDYQKKQGLAVDGIVGKNTWGSLLGTTADSGSSGTTGKQVLSGVSDETSDRLAALEQGYQPSDEVQAAQALRESLSATKPGDYTSTFDEELQRLYRQLTAQGGFSYDPEQDAAYQTYARLYQQSGEAAMADTMGQAAALTGGYGSSYAQTAAQQSYNQYMQQLAALLPELEQQALARHQAEGKALQDKYEAALDAQTQEKAAWEQAYEAWLAELERSDESYQDAYQRDFNQYKLLLDYFADKAKQEQKASDGRKANSGKPQTGEKKQESLSSAAAESLQRAMGNYLKAGNEAAAVALADQYASRMTPAQKKRFVQLFEKQGAAWGV